MTRQETGMIMDILRAAYPRFYSNQIEVANALNLWYDMFVDDDVRVVATAVKAFIATDDVGFPPHIGAIKKQIRHMKYPDELTEMEAWNLVSKAIKNGIYGSQKEFDALPDAVKMVVGSPAQLKEWALIDSDVVQSVIASNFQRSYKEKIKHISEIRSLPSDVKKVAGELSEQLKLQTKQTLDCRKSDEQVLNDAKNEVIKKIVSFGVQSKKAAY